MHNPTLQKIPWQDKFKFEDGTYTCLDPECRQQCNTGKAIRSHALQKHGCNVIPPNKSTPKAELKRGFATLKQEHDALKKKYGELVVESIALQRALEDARRERELKDAGSKRQRRTSTAKLMEEAVTEAIEETMEKFAEVYESEPQQLQLFGSMYEWIRMEPKVWRMNLIVEIGSIRMHLPWFCIKKSTITNAGFGLFAARNFAEGDRIGFYWGIPASRSIRKQSPYVLVKVDAVGGHSKPQQLRLGLHFMNDPAFGVKDGETKDELLKKVNVQFGVQYDAVTTRSIKEGEELFVDYNYKGCK